MRWLVNVRDYGLEYAAKRFYSLYGGEVVDNGDTQQQGRIKLKTGVTGVGIRRPDGVLDPATICRQALPGSVYAGLDHGLYFPPEVGDSVWVSFDHGDPCHPRYHGSWWKNIDPSKTAAGSELPSEFKQTDGELAQPLATRPFRRGIKTKFGHGLIFSDNETAPFVTLWSGRQEGPRQPATRKQQFALSDVPGQEGIIAQTFYGHRIYLDDADKSITISGLSPDPTGLFANSIKIEDKTGKITIKTKMQQVVTIDDSTTTLSVSTPGQVSVTAGGALSITAASITTASGAGGPAVENGAGAKVSNFVGDATETIGGVFTQNVIGAMNLSAASLNLTAALINFLGVVVIGSPLTARALANDYLIDYVLNHTHPTAALGPPSIPTPGPLSTIVTPGMPLPPITLLQYGSTTLKAT
jgi:hypothetical protein